MKRMSTNEKSTPVTLEELTVSSLAQTVTLSKLLIEKGIITQQSSFAEISGVLLAVLIIPVRTRF
jgi:hypothetical protein